MKNISQDTWCAGQESNWQVPEYESEALPLESSYFRFHHRPLCNTRQILKF
jgi:hypothetical protein